MNENRFWKVTYSRNEVENFYIVWAVSKEDAEEKAVKLLIKDGLATNCTITEVRVWGVVAA